MYFGGSKLHKAAVGYIKRNYMRAGIEPLKQKLREAMQLERMTDFILTQTDRTFMDRHDDDVGNWIL